MQNLTINKLEGYLSGLFNRLPRLNQTARYLIISRLPSAIILIGSILLVLTAIDLITGKIYSFYDKNYIINDILFYVSNIVVSIVLFTSYRPLKNRMTAGWRSLYYLNLIMLLIAIISGPLIGVAIIIIAVCFFYLLFQIRPDYNNH